MKQLKTLAGAHVWTFVLKHQQADNLAIRMPLLAPLLAINHPPQRYPLVDAVGVRPADSPTSGFVVERLSC